MSISIRRPGNEWLKQFEKYLINIIKQGKYSEKSICGIAFLNEGMKPDTTSKYIRHLTEFGVIEEDVEGILKTIMDMRDLEPIRENMDEKKKPYKKAKKELEKGEIMEININENEKYIIYVKDCITRKELPIDLGTWKYQNECNPDIVEQEGTGKDVLPIKLPIRKGVK